MFATAKADPDRSVHFSNIPPRKLGAKAELGMDQGGFLPVECDEVHQAKQLHLELQLMVQEEVERAEHAAMMAGAFNRSEYLGLAHPDPVSVERRRTASMLSYRPWMWFWAKVHIALALL